MSNPKEFSWQPPTTNVDGSAIVAGEITGYQIGIRPSTGTVGTYPTLVSVSGPTTTAELLSALPTPLAAGSYNAAIQTVGPIDSAWSTEIAFTIAPPTPGPPTGFTSA